MATPILGAPSAPSAPFLGPGVVRVALILDIPLDEILSPDHRFLADEIGITRAVRQRVRGRTSVPIINGGSTGGSTLSA